MQPWDSVRGRVALKSPGRNGDAHGNRRWLTIPGGERRQTWPLVPIAVEVEECYLQCAKALIRSKLWEPHERPNPPSLPSAAEMFADQVQMPEFDVAAMQTLLDGAYRDRLY